MRETDLRFEVVREGPHVTVRVTHMPTGQSATAHGASEHQSREVALTALRILLGDAASAPEGSVMLSPGSAILDLSCEQ